MVSLPTAVSGNRVQESSGVNNSDNVQAHLDDKSVRVILPTEWAKLDVITLAYYKDLITDRGIYDGP